MFSVFGPTQKWLCRCNSSQQPTLPQSLALRAVTTRRQETVLAKVCSRCVAAARPYTNSVMHLAQATGAPRDPLCSGATQCFFLSLLSPRPVTFSQALRYPLAILAASSLRGAPAPASRLAHALSTLPSFAVVAYACKGGWAPWTATVEGTKNTAS